jgi:hypothetical protein
LLAFAVPAWLGIPNKMRIVGLTISAGMSAWIEFTLLRSALSNRIGKAGLQASYLAQIWLIAIIAAVPAFAEKLWLKGLPPLISGPLVLLTYGLIFFGSATMLKVPEALALIRTVSAKLRLR